MEYKGTRFTFEHTIIFNTREKTLPYRSVRCWRTPKGALRAAEARAKSMNALFREGSINMHAIQVFSDLHESIITEAA